MYAQTAIKPNPLLRNGAYGIVMRGVQKCTRGCSSLRGRKRLPLCCIKLDTATDPCMGSGHILVAMFDVLMDIYKSAGYSERDAALLIVQKNIYGLDIDKRAYQLVYFAVMMKGRQYNRRFLRCSENKIYPYVYAIKDSRNVDISHLQYFGKKMKEQARTVAEAQLKRLIKDFENADENGAITNIAEINKALLDEFIGQYSIENQYDLYTVGIDKTQAILKILVQQAYVMTRKYDAVVTNPPYMGSSGMDSQLSEYVKINYKLSKGDMSTVCMEKAMYMSKYGGYISMINIPVWMFITSYEKFREYLLSEKTFVNMIHPGRGIFGSDFGTVTFISFKCADGLYTKERSSMLQHRINICRQYKS